MRDLVLAELTEHQLWVVVQHLTRRLFDGKGMNGDQRVVITTQLLRFVVELKIREAEGRLASAQETLFGE